MAYNEHSSGTKRSRSPQREKDSSRDVKKRRSRSPTHHRHDRPLKDKLPFRSPHLDKHDFVAYRALFADYLDLQKQLDIERLSEDEVKGRWKSFLGKWNRGELAEGWYDPETKEKADERAARPEDIPSLRRHEGSVRPRRKEVTEDEDEEDEDEDENYGPALPPFSKKKSGPTAPNFQDLQHRRELDEEAHQAAKADLRYERKQDRATQKERLEELAPRAEPGSRERQLEKKREVAASNKTFAEAREAGTEEVGDGELMGDDGVEGFKARRKEMEKQKNERELRKEEVLRARAAAREERLGEHRRKEEKTMQMLRELAQQRFGAQ